jgi:hypothetical protein
MTFKLEARPSDSPYIDKVWRTTLEDVGSFFSQAATHSEIVVMRYRGQTVLTFRGPETKATELDYSMVGAEFMGIEFKMGAFMPEFLPKNLRDFRDVNFRGAGRKFWLHGSTWQFPTFENAEIFVKRLVHDELLVRDPIVEGVLKGWTPDLSVRAVQYRFLQATGLTQKAVRQIERAHQAVDLLATGQSIVDTVYEMGYFDQSHLTNSLKRFLGQTPTQFVAPSGG